MRSRSPLQRATTMVIAGVVAVLAGAFGAIKAADEVAFEHRALRLDGLVVALEAQRTHRARGPAYAPVFRITPPGAAPRDIASRVGSRPPAWAVGDRAVVLFDPSAPDRVVADTLGQRWGLSLAFGAASLFFAVVCVVALVT